MDQTLLETLVSTLVNKLKTSYFAGIKCDCARYLQTIYKQYTNSSIRDKITPLIGMMIYAGRIHTDEDNSRSYTEEEICYAGQCGGGWHDDYSDHTDIPASSAGYFYVE
jgi:hypothetical protein